MTRQPVARFREGDEVISAEAATVKRIRRAVATRGGNWVYVLEGENVLWEERLLHGVPHPAAQTLAEMNQKANGPVRAEDERNEREPGEEG